MIRIATMAALLVAGSSIFPDFASGGCLRCQLINFEQFLCGQVEDNGGTTCHMTTTTCSVSGQCTAGGGGCFLKGALISTPLGPRPIETLEVGDVVWSQIPGGDIQSSRVSRTYEDEAHSYLVINEGLRVTESHPFYVDGEWVVAGNLERGQSFAGGMAPLATVSSIRRIDRGVRVYNIEVEGSHTFFVNGLLVHNKQTPGQD